MELGEKIRAARLAAGLSQRQLCGEDITRNMLSLIENGGAKPSVKTLTLLAERLGKPVSYFLDENARDPELVTGDFENLRQARKALAEGKDRYAAQLLDAVTVPELLREALLLKAKIPGADASAICRALPSLDEELLLRAEAALKAEEWDRCDHLLAAVEDHKAPRWNFCAGKREIARKNWEKAAQHLALAETVYSEAIPLLEACFRELGDYKRAYEYACKQRK